MLVNYGSYGDSAPGRDMSNDGTSNDENSPPAKARRCIYQHGNGGTPCIGIQSRASREIQECRLMSNSYVYTRDADN